MSYATVMKAIEDLAAPLEGARVLDIGCGRGRLCRALLKRGAHVTGIDPSADLLAEAREAAPEATFHQAGGEALPLDDASFDRAIILNALHHVPLDAMKPALAEAMRVLGESGSLLILEPLARGGYHEVFAPVDDETEVRALALSVLEAFVAGGGAVEESRVEFDTLVPEESAESVLRYASRIDPRRTERIEAVRGEVETLFDRHVVQTERGPALEQPMVAVVLRPTG